MQIILHKSIQCLSMRFKHRLRCLLTFDCVIMYLSSALRHIAIDAKSPQLTMTYQ